MIPTYNEADNLPGIDGGVAGARHPRSPVLIVDDNSPDGTGRVADTLAQRFPGIVNVRHRPGKEGLGRAYLDGFGIALGMGADYIIQMDADFSHPTSAIPKMLALMPEYDVVVGSRYVRGRRAG